VDVWAVGVLAFELLVGKAPFYHISRKETMRSIMNVINSLFSAIFLSQPTSPSMPSFSSRRLYKKTLMSVLPFNRC
jgi:hypothetical protein